MEYKGFNIPYRVNRDNIWTKVCYAANCRVANIDMCKTCLFSCENEHYYREWITNQERIRKEKLERILK